MVAESPDKQTCAGCGATFAANLRYCVDCYRPVASAVQSRAHIETARQVETTRRADPTVVFLPEAHEARLRRAKRRQRTVIASVIVVLLTVTALGVWLALTGQ